MNHPEEHCIALFASIHHVLAAEKALREQEIWCDLVPTPKRLSSDCGMSVELRREDLPAARRLFSGDRWRLLGLYPREGGEPL